MGSWPDRGAAVSIFRKQFLSREALMTEHFHCPYCGQRIAHGTFCTGEHKNLYIARIGNPPDPEICTRPCKP